MLTVLMNRLGDRGDDTITVSHPAPEIGDLLSITLGKHDACTVAFEQGTRAYSDARDEVGRTHPERVYNDLPTASEYTKAVLGSGILPIDNLDEVETFVDRYGDPDLMAGHPPVFAGFDTNLLPWRIDEVLGLRDPETGVGYVNGFVLATGVRDELDWDNKCHDSRPFEEAFGDVYEEYWNQPLGSARVGRLGMLQYRNIRDIQQAGEIECDRGDDAIIAGYDQWSKDHRGEVLLFSNDRNFVERARAHTILAQRIDFPNTLPTGTSATWRQLERLLYILAITFGILELPTITLYGVWRGKDELDWQRERLKADCRSPKVTSRLQADLSIVETYNDLTD
jgi:hypothetical protein